jgi:hypothetical protein
MELLRIAKGDIEIYRYYSLNLYHIYYHLNNNKRGSFLYRKERKIADIIMSGEFDLDHESYFLIKTIPAAQLKLLVLLKPDITIEELLDEENKLFEHTQPH